MRVSARERCRESANTENCVYTHVRTENGVNNLLGGQTGGKAQQLLSPGGLS